MQLTKHTDYGLRVLIYLCALAKDRNASIDEIAQTFEVSRNHINKIVHRLGLEGFITTQRGKGGGIRLGPNPSEIVVGDVVRILESNLEPVDCGQPTPCLLLPSCKLKFVLDDAVEAFMRELDAYTLADIVTKKDVIKLVG